MTHDEIIRMAHKAGFEVNFDIWAVSVDGVHINKELRRFAAQAAAAEREACAKVCEEQGKGRKALEHYAALTYSGSAHDCAAAIRARGEK